MAQSEQRGLILSHGSASVTVEMGLSQSISLAGDHVFIIAGNKENLFQGTASRTNTLLLLLLTASTAYHAHLCLFSMFTKRRSIIFRNAWHTYTVVVLMALFLTVLEIMALHGLLSP